MSTVVWGTMNWTLRKKVKLLTEENQRLKQEIENNCGEPEIDTTSVKIPVLDIFEIFFNFVQIHPFRYENVFEKTIKICWKAGLYILWTWFVTIYNKQCVQ